MAGLHFDTKEGAFRETGGNCTRRLGAQQAVFEDQQPERSDEMPPKMSGRKLTPVQIETLKNWIDQGAKWETHWSYTPPTRPELPAVQDTKWVP